MTKRLRRSLATLTLSLPLWAVMGITPGPTSAQDMTAQRFDRGVWRITAATEHPADYGVVLADVRLSSPTTFIVAQRVTIQDGAIRARDVVVHGRDFRLSAPIVQIDSGTDAVQISPRALEPQE